MKKILFVNSNLSSGGSERVMTLLANEMCKNYDVEMVLLHPAEEVYYLDEKVPKHYIKNKYKFLPKIQKFLNFRKVIKRINPDYIISFMLRNNLYTILASSFLRKKIIVSERAHPGLRSKKMRFAEKIMYKKKCVKKVVFQTEDVKNYYEKKIIDKSVVIPNPIVIDKIDKSYNEKSKKIIGIGRLTEQKNFPLLINAFAEIHTKYPEYTLHIYGKGPMLNELTEMVERLNLNDYVHFEGFVNNIKEVISDYYMYISTSDFEGISNAMLEALALGVPCICTDCPVGGARMVIESGINGELIPVKDKEALVLAMTKILDNPNIAKKYSENGKKILEKFGIENITQEWKKLID